MWPAPSAGPLDRVEVLVVEDSWHVATLIKRWLESEGARVIGPASTIGIGHILADVHRPQVAVVDLNLGGSFAYPLITSLNRLGVPVIVVTAYSFAGEVTPNLGAVLAKPVEKNALIEAVQAAFDAIPEPPQVQRPRQDLS